MTCCRSLDTPAGVVPLTTGVERAPTSRQPVPAHDGSLRRYCDLLLTPPSSLCAGTLVGVHKPVAVPVELSACPAPPTGWPAWSSMVPDGSASLAP